MDDREVIARALVKRNYPNASEADLAEMVEGFMPDAHASLSAFLAHLEASGRVIVPVEATAEMLAAVLPRTQEGDALDYALGERACSLLGLSLPSGEVAAVDLSRDYRALIAAAKDQTDG